MELEGPSAPTLEDRWVKTVIRLAQLCLALDRPKSAPGTPEGRTIQVTLNWRNNPGMLLKTKDRKNSNLECL